jgi:hypothetical protein
MKTSSFNQLILLLSLALFGFSCQNNAPKDADADATDSAAIQQPAPEPASKGVLSITSSPDLTLAEYDKLAAAMTQSGQWTKDWTYNAIGSMQPKGIFSFGVYPSQEALDRRRAIYADLFPKLGINAAPPAVHEIHNIIVGSQPAQKPAGGIIMVTGTKGLTTEQYDKVISALESAGLGAPAGRMYHVAYKTDDGLRVLSVFESEAQAKALREKLNPILQANGMEAIPPTVYPLHNFVVGS